MKLWLWNSESAAATTHFPWVQAWNTWAAAVEAKHAALEAMEGVVARWRSSRLSSAFNALSWHVHMRRCKSASDAHWMTRRGRAIVLAWRMQVWGESLDVCASDVNVCER